MPHLNAYLAFYKDADIEIYAPSANDAQIQAVKLFNLHKTQAWRIKTLVVQRGVTEQQLAEDDAVMQAASYYYAWQSPEMAA